MLLLSIDERLSQFLVLVLEIFIASEKICIINAYHNGQRLPATMCNHYFSTSGITVFGFPFLADTVWQRFVVFLEPVPCG